MKKVSRSQSYREGYKSGYRDGFIDGQRMEKENRDSNDIEKSKRKEVRGYD